MVVVALGMHSVLVDGGRDPVAPRTAAAAVGDKIGGGNLVKDSARTTPKIVQRNLSVFSHTKYTNNFLN